MAGTSFSIVPSELIRLALNALSGGAITVEQVVFLDAPDASDGIECWLATGGIGQLVALWWEPQNETLHRRLMAMMDKVTLFRIPFQVPELLKELKSKGAIDGSGALHWTWTDQAQRLAYLPSLLEVLRARVRHGLPVAKGHHVGEILSRDKDFMDKQSRLEEFFCAETANRQSKSFGLRILIVDDRLSLDLWKRWAGGAAKATCAATNGNSRFLLLKAKTAPDMAKPDWRRCSAIDRIAAGLIRALAVKDRELSVGLLGSFLPKSESGDHATSEQLEHCLIEEFQWDRSGSIERGLVNSFDLIFIDALQEPSDGAPGRQPAGLVGLLPALAREKVYRHQPWLILLTRFHGTDIARAAFGRGADWVWDKRAALALVQEPKRMSRWLAHMVAMSEAASHWGAEKDIYMANWDTLWRTRIRGFQATASEEDKYVVIKLLEDYPSGVGDFNIESLAGGKSGAAVYLVHPITKNGEFTPCVIKITGAEDVLLERYNYQHWISVALSNSCGRIENDVIFTSKKGAVRYNAVGNLLDYSGGRKPRMLYDVMLDARVKSCDKTALVERLFEVVLPPLYNLEGDVHHAASQSSTSPAAHEEWNLAERMLRHSPIRVIESSLDMEKSGPWWQVVKGNRIRRLGWEMCGNPDAVEYHIQESSEKDTSASQEQFSSFSLVRPGRTFRAGIESPTLREFYQTQLSCFDNWYEACKEAIRSSVGSEPVLDHLGRIICKAAGLRGLRFGVIHGDLQPRNVMVTQSISSAPSLWLIDFEKSRRGFVVEDFVKLEMSIRAGPLSDVLEAAMQSQEKKTIDAVGRYYLCSSRSWQEHSALLAAPGPEMTLSSDAETILKDCLEVISVLRAKALAMGVSTVEYFAALYFMSLGYVSMDQLVKIDETEKNGYRTPLRRYVAYLTAALALEKLNQMESPS